MKVDDSIIKAYTEGQPASVYSNRWIFHSLDSEKMFTEPSLERIPEVISCHEQLLELYNNFTLRNEGLIRTVFSDVTSVVKNANILHTVGLPWPYAALMCGHEGVDYVVFDLIHFSNSILKGADISAGVSNLLTHELVHVLINAEYGRDGDFSYSDKLDFISFHEGFAHLLSYKENIENYQYGDEYKARFVAAKERLALALKEIDPELQNQYILESSTGDYWDKFAAASSMIYLMKHIGSLKEIYEAGWKGYAQSIVDFVWE